MSVVQVMNVKLQRTDPSVSWGFNVQGGKEFYSPLLIQKVNANSLAEKCSIRPGDFILRIGNIIAENFTHAQARDAIVRQGNNLELTLQRGAPPRSDDYNARFDFPQHQLMTPENIERVPVASPQVGLQLNNNKALLTQSYNSPMGLYSSQNIADTLVTTIKNFENQDTSSTQKDFLSSSLSSSSISSFASTSTSISPVSSTSSTSNSIPAHYNKPTLHQFDLNPKPKPFFLKQAQTIEPKKYESLQIITNPIVESQENTYHAVPIKQTIEFSSPRISDPMRRLSSQSIMTQSFTDSAKLKDDLKNELLSRLNPHERVRKGSATINGRLLLKNLENSDNTKQDNEIKSVKNVYTINRAQSPQRSSSQVNKIRNLARGSIGQLDDPTKPSVIQSRSFKLLQETLDKGLREKDAVFYDSITNKNQFRRCSLNVNVDSSTSNNDKNSDILEKAKSKLNRLKLSEKYSLDEDQEDEFFNKQNESNSDELSKSLNQNDRTRSKSLANDLFAGATHNTPARSNNLLIEAKSAKNLNCSPLAFSNKPSTNFTKPLNINDPNLVQEAHKIKPTARNNEIVNPKPVVAKASSFNSNKNNSSSGAYMPSAQVPVQSQSYQSPQFKPVSQPQAQSYQPQHHHLSPPGAPPTRAPAGKRIVIRGSKGSALLNNPNSSASIPTCAACGQLVRGPFVSAVGKIWCPNHFVCAHPNCGTSLQDIGFVEENGQLYCERDYKTYFAPTCYKCNSTILGECSYALEKSFHPECFTCGKCKQKIGTGSFHIEDGVPYCERDFNALFSVKCSGCQFAIEAGDKFLEALNQKWHVECFICSTCNVPLQNTGFATKGNKPYCKKHAY